MGHLQVPFLPKLPVMHQRAMQASLGPVQERRNPPSFPLGDPRVLASSPFIASPSRKKHLHADFRRTRINIRTKKAHGVGVGRTCAGAPGLHGGGCHGSGVRLSSAPWGWDVGSCIQLGSEECGPHKNRNSSRSSCWALINNPFPAPLCWPGQGL